MKNKQLMPTKLDIRRGTFSLRSDVNLIPPQFQSEMEIIEDYKMIFKMRVEGY